MKILHISTASSGGSWTSACLLVNHQKEMGYESELLTLQDIDASKHEQKRILSKFLRKINTLYSSTIAKKEYEFLSIYSTSAGLIPHLRKAKPDVVHIHNWFNLINYKEIKEIGRLYPVVFTMHDSRLATGGCHIPYECVNYSHSCMRCPAVKIGTKQIVHAKEKTISAIKNMKSYAIIAPSNWILTQANKSGITENSTRSEVVYNIAPECIPLTTKPIKMQRIKLLFIAANLNSKTKGLQTLLDSIGEILIDDKEIQIHLVGAGEVDLKRYSNPGLQIIAHGMLSSREISALMGTADMLVVPSTSENFPNVVLEAFAMGLIVVASDVGGISEMIKHEVNGYLFKGSHIQLSKSILLALRKMNEWDKVRIEAQKSITTKYDNRKSLLQITNIYEELIKNFSESSLKL